MRRLVVSEQLIIRSIGLMELPLLVTKFGYDGVKELLASGRVRLLCQAMFTANIGQYADRLNGPVLPPGSYSFSALRASPTPEMLSSDLHRINDVAGVSDKQARKLRRLAGSRLIRFPDDAGQAAEAEFKRELANNVPLLKTAVALSAQRATGTPIAPDRFQLHVERLSEARRASSAHGCAALIRSPTRSSPRLSIPSRMQSAKPSAVGRAKRCGSQRRRASESSRHR